MQSISIKTLALPFVVLLSSCSGSGGNDVDCVARPVVFRSPPVNEPSFCQNLSSTLVIKDRMGQQVSSFSAGETITFEAGVTNNSSTAVTVTKSSGCPQVTFEAYKSTNQIDWSSNDGFACTQALEDVTYAPGETKMFTGEWQQKLCRNMQAPAGQYTVRTQDTTQCWARIDKSATFTLQ